MIVFINLGLDFWRHFCTCNSNKMPRQSKSQVLIATDFSWSWLPRISICCACSFNAFSLVAELLLRFGPQRPTYYLFGGPSDSLCPCHFITIMSAELQPASVTQKLFMARVSWCRWGFLPAKVQVVFITEISRRKGVTSIHQVSCPSSWLQGTLK